MTSVALRAYLYGLPFYCIFKLLGPTFYALDKEKYPILISVFSILVNIIFSVSLIDTYGFVILAYGVSLSVIVNSILQVIFLRPILGIGFRFFITVTAIRVLSSGVIALGLTVFLKSFLPIVIYFLVQDFCLCFFILGLVFSFVYLICLYLLGAKEQIRVFHK